jgi:hypothetical protein
MQIVGALANPLNLALQRVNLIDQSRYFFLVPSSLSDLNTARLFGLESAR